METRISHRALKQSQNELRVCCGRRILFSASNPGSVHSLRQKLNPVSQEVSKPASAPAPTNKNANRLRTIVMKTQKQIRWPRQDVDNKVLSVRWHPRQKISLDRRGNSKQATGVTGGTVSSDPSLESLARNSKIHLSKLIKLKKKTPSHSLWSRGEGTRQRCSTKGISFKQPLMVDAAKTNT